MLSCSSVADKNDRGCLVDYFASSDQNGVGVASSPRPDEVMLVCMPVNGNIDWRGIKHGHLMGLIEK